MTSRGWAIFAVVGWSLTVAGGLGALVLRVVRPTTIPATTFGLGDAAIAAFVVLGATWASVGALLVLRRPENAVGRYMILAGSGYALSMLTGVVTFVAMADASEGGRGSAAVAGWLTVVLSSVGGLAFLYLGFVFPTGRSHSRRWDRLRRAMGPIMVVPGAVLLSQPGPLLLFPGIDNPFGFGPDLRVTLGDRVLPLMSASLGILAVAAILSVVSRYRTAARTERQQLKWFMSAIAASVAGLVLTSFEAVVGTGPPGEGPLIAFGLAGTTVPVAIGIAILRYRLFEIDRIISRTLSYAVVTGILALVFGSAILLLQGVLAPFTQGQTIAVAASTLAVFALFQPVRRRVQKLVDLRFDRARYDADRMIESLAGRLRADLDLATVSREIARTADAAVRPTSASVWLRGSSR